MPLAGCVSINKVPSSSSLRRYGYLPVFLPNGELRFNRVAALVAQVVAVYQERHFLTMDLPFPLFHCRQRGESGEETFDEHVGLSLPFLR